jgi:DNA-binding SARP family transcriptional activator/tetratricopeptide (TPR) repeat protein
MAGAMSELGDAVRSRRRALRLSQRQLARRAGISVAVVRDLEQGRTGAPRPASVRRLGDVLGLPATAGTIRVQVLGPLIAWRHWSPVNLGGSRQRTVLGLLALSPDEPVSRDAIVDVLWPGGPPDTAAGAVASCVSRLRALLGADVIRRVASGYRLDVGVDQLDLLEFHALCAQADRTHDAALVGDLLERALGLWHGGPVADLVPLRDHPAVVALTNTRLEAAALYTGAALELGQPHRVLPTLRALCSNHPLHEPLHITLIRALTAAGQRADALAVFDGLARRLADELGVGPGPQLLAARGELLAAAGSPALPVPQPLPTDIAEFTGRRAELERLDTLAEAATGHQGHAGAPIVCLIYGMAGVGKTRLAVHAAHRLANRFDGPQLWAGLHGFVSDQPPTDPTAVLEDLLRLLGVPDAVIPGGLPARAAAYRDRLARRPALVVLDDAASEEQVLPLLPGSPGCLVLVTSRRRLAIDGAYPVPLDVFTTTEALGLLSQVVGADRVAAEPAMAAQVVRQCGRLPVAVALAARRLQTRPAWTVADLAHRLDDLHRRLGELTAGSRAVRSTFDLSYQVLPAGRARLFRLLALHPGREVTAGSAAALADLAPDRAGALLEALLDEHLVEQDRPDRYRLHDLLHTYARDRAEAEETALQRDAAVSRVLSWYGQAADAANRVLFPLGRHLDPDLWRTVRHPATFPDRRRALEFLDAERTTLVAAVTLAARRGHSALAWQLTAAMWGFFHLRKHFDDWLATHHTALTAARTASDRDGQAWTLTTLAIAHTDLHRDRQACSCAEEALRLRRATGDRIGQAITLTVLGIARTRLGEHLRAVTCYQQAHTLYAQLGDHRGQALTATHLAEVARQLGHYNQALTHATNALATQRQITDRHSQRLTLATLGDIQRDLRNHPQALAHYRDALTICHELDDRWTTARILTNQAHALEATGDHTAARDARRQAMIHYDELGDTETTASLSTLLAVETR